MSASEAISCNPVYTISDLSFHISCCNDLAIIAFEQSGNKVQGRYKGLPVYPHKDYEPIRQGEKWLCELLPNTVKNFFAIPIMRVDPAILFELLPEQRRELARILLEDYPDKVASIVGHDQLEGAATEDSVAGGQSDHPEPGDSSEPQMVNTPDDKDGGDEQESEPLIHRAGHNALVSVLFTEPAYDVLISRDRRVMRINPKSKGSVRCRDGRISLKGLDDIIPEIIGRSFKPMVNDRTGVITVIVE